MFIDRETLLDVLFGNLKHKFRVLTRSQISRVGSYDNHIGVHTTDGSTHAGDIVVGGDGVHSTVRKEIWRIAKQSHLNPFQHDEISGSSAAFWKSLLAYRVLTLSYQVSVQSRDVFLAFRNVPPGYLRATTYAYPDQRILFELQLHGTVRAALSYILTELHQFG